MKSNLPKRLALKTLIKHKCYLLNNYADLRRIIEFNQFTIIEYKKHTNSQHVSELIKTLRLENEIEQNDSFLYINNNIKLLFLYADASEDDKCALLRHELGHIIDPNFKNDDVCYSKIKKEEFANEFSFYVRNPDIRFMIYVFLTKKWELLVSAFALIACIFGVAFYANTMFVSPNAPTISDASTDVLSGDTYYVTSAGRKYHRKHCIIIRYKNNLTEIKLNDAVEAGYKPCSICIFEKE